MVWRALLFSDIEGSTRLLQRHGSAYLEQLAVHQELLRSCWAAHGGEEEGTEGDSFFVTFPTAAAAAAAALAAQLALAAHPWPDGVEIRVRIGVHAGEVLTVGTELAGMTVHEAARIAGAGHGGQVLLSDAVRTDADLSPPAALLDLGDHQLKDIPRPLRLWQLTHHELRVAFPPLRSTGRTPHNIPAPASALVGRSREIAEIAALLDEHRVVTITGAGGAGKTRVAIHTAAAVLARFPTGVWLVELAPLERDDSVAGALAGAMGLELPPAGDPLEAVAEHLGSGASLVVLDNCEHLVAGVADVVDALVRRCPDLRVLATSREMLSVAGETAWRLPNLGDNEAVRLLVDRAVASGAPPSIGDEVETLKEICARLDGIPLALELAAARLASLGADQVLARLDQRFRLLTGGRRTAMARQRTLQGTIDWSYDLLSDGERALLRILGVFHGFDVAAAETVAGALGLDELDVVDDLNQLVAKSMVVVESGDGTVRYRLLETLRQYALDRLLERGTAEAIAARAAHARWAATVVASAMADAYAGRDRAATAVLRREHANLMRAVDWGASVGDRSVALRCVAPWWYWIERGLLQEGRRVGHVALAAEGDSDITDIVPVLSVIAMTSRGLRDDAVGEALVKEASELVTDPEVPGWCRGWVAVLKGLVAIDHGDLDGMRAAVAEVESQMQGHQVDVQMRGWLLDHRAALAELDGDLAAARSLRAELLELARTAESTFAACQALAALARASTTPRDEARGLLTEAIERARRDEDPTQEFFGWWGLGSHLRDVDARASADAFEEALALARRYRSDKDIGEMLNEVAWSSLLAGDVEAALPRAEEAVAVLATTARLDKLHVIHTLAEAERRAGLTDRSVQHFTEIIAEVGTQPTAPWTERALREAQEGLEAIAALDADASSADEIDGQAAAP